MGSGLQAVGRGFEQLSSDGDGFDGKGQRRRGSTKTGLGSCLLGGSCAGDGDDEDPAGFDRRHLDSRTEEGRRHDWSCSCDRQGREMEIEITI
ncbi:unnamed protein product [Linum trigynum]|uniref:Uncharacterized protein n=1 Tax=Linum trigynum TaxID=586398 RepID=A0AAV2FF37_9ROSI